MRTILVLVGLSAVAFGQIGMSGRISIGGTPASGVIYGYNYGMRCDSTTGSDGTDNATPLQNAINAAQNPPGLTLLLPSGLCRYTVAPSITRKITMLGQGTTGNFHNYGTILYLNSTSQACAINIAEAAAYATAGSEIGEFQLVTTDTTANHSGVCITNTTAQYWSIHNIYFQNFTGWGFNWGALTYFQSCDFSQLVFSNDGGAMGSDVDYSPRGTLVNFSQIDFENGFNSTSPKAYIFDLYGFGESQVNYMTAEGASYPVTAIVNLGNYNQMRIRNLHIEITAPYPTYSIQLLSPDIQDNFLYIEDAYGLSDQYPIRTDGKTSIHIVNSIVLFGASVGARTWSKQVSFVTSGIGNVIIDGVNGVVPDPALAGLIYFNRDDTFGSNDGQELYSYTNGYFNPNQVFTSFTSAATQTPATDSSEGRVLTFPQSAHFVPLTTYTITPPANLVGGTITVALRYYLDTGGGVGTIINWTPLSIRSGISASNGKTSFVAAGTEQPVFDAWGAAYVTIQGVTSTPIVMQTFSDGSSVGNATLKISEFRVLSGRKSPLLAGKTAATQAITTYSTAAPTTGTWVAGDIVQNSAPSASGTGSWICTVSGTPGTWKTLTTVGP